MEYSSPTSIIDESPIKIYKKWDGGMFVNQ